MTIGKEPMTIGTEPMTIGTGATREVLGDFTPELKAKWVEALRSGKYRQGHHQLNDDGAYCCLGVLNEIAGLCLPGDNEYLTREGAELLIDRGTQADLAYRNDGGDGYLTHDFNEIAAFIEENF